MAHIDNLVSEITDPLLRRQMQAAVKDLKARTKFGLHFEQHLPERTVLPGLPVTVGAVVVKKQEIRSGRLYRVESIDGEHATLCLEKGDDTSTALLTDLRVVKSFHEPIYPTLTEVDRVERGEDKPFHTLINAENFHAVQLLVYLYEGKVDCLYLDPPYNTGAKDWTYNNQYIDSTDAYRHSKWLSFMEKRLKLAKRLLKPDGVLIVAIDEHEVHHLGMLLEETFPEYLRYMVTVIINPKGTYKQNLSRVDEQAMFVVPQLGKSSVIKDAPKSTKPKIDVSDADEDEEDNDLDPLDEFEVTNENADELEPENNNDEWEYQHARRRGTESSYRHQRYRQFYPIYIDELEKRVSAVGDYIEADSDPDFTSPIEGLRAIWPIDAEEMHRVWRFSPESMRRELEAGNLFLGQYNKDRDSWTINIRRPKKTSGKIKTVWVEKQYDAGTHGTGMVRKLLGKPGLFAFPKSLYLVKECIAAVTRNRPNALIVDFFAGSGTTLHATALLNSENGGQRRCILVTNNEVKAEDTTTLNRAGYFLGEPEFEALGIATRVTWPRCKAALTGIRPDGQPVPGNHIGGRPLADGFPENMAFFRLGYADPQAVDLGQQFDAIVPLLWLKSGAFGTFELFAPQVQEKGYSVPPHARYAVLLEECYFRSFLHTLSNRPDVTHVFLVTDSEESFAEMQASLPLSVQNTTMLYRDYLRSFRLRTEGQA